MVCARPSVLNRLESLLVYFFKNSKREEKNALVCSTPMDLDDGPILKETP